MALKQQKRPRDINQRAASTVAIATGEAIDNTTEEAPESTSEERHNAATMLGRRGGKTRAERLSPEQRKEIAKTAASARWKKKPS
jgi:hypothetical protein